MKCAKLIILLIFILFASCDKDNDTFKSVGIIAGEDFMMCACCGGYIIYIDDVRYLFDSMPKDSDLNLQQETFPLTVRLDWELIKSGCPLLRIDVLRIKKD
jgi:hypothetical protein